MIITNRERGKALHLLEDGLQPFVEREKDAPLAHRWFDAVKAGVHDLARV
jgi:hypothetical protein